MGFNGFVMVGVGGALGCWLRWTLGVMFNPVFPTGTFNAPDTAYLDQPFTISVTNVSQPDGLDHSPSYFSYVLSCNGFPLFTATPAAPSSQTCTPTKTGPLTVGAILVTLLPETDPCTWDSFHWKEPPPPDALARHLGRPHLTWIFVSPFYAGQGIGTLLLSAVVKALLDLGYAQLASTFLIGNDSSMLWHWRNGFRLQAYPGSYRKFKI